LRPPLLIHLHVPRTAGTTLSRIIRLKLLAERPAHWFHRPQVFGFDFVPPLERAAYVKSLPDEDKRHVRYFGAHMGYGIHAYLPAPCVYVTILRDPADRAVSLYGYLKQRERLPRGLSFEGFMHRRNRFYFDNGQVRYLAGEDGNRVDVPFGQCTRAMLDLAKRRIDTDLFLTGLTEQFDETVVLLRRRLGWRTCYYSVSNMTRRARGSEEIPPQMIDAVRATNGLDLELCRHAREHLGEQIRREGESFAGELRRFKNMNRRYDRLLGPVRELLPAGKALAVTVERLWRKKPAGR
jgi:hypothetical protein